MSAPSSPPGPAMTHPEPARFPRRRAPRNSLNREVIIESALRLLDGKGIDAFTMRALAADLGVGPMALYTYFAGKEELFEAARERLLARYRPPATEGTPREQLRRACLAVHRLFAEHPAVIELLIGRPGPCEAAAAGIEHMLGLLRRCGLGPGDAARAQTALMQYTLGGARWTARGGPPATRAQFEYGLEALLEGLVGRGGERHAEPVVDHGGAGRGTG